MSNGSERNEERNQQQFTTEFIYSQNQLIQREKKNTRRNRNIFFCLCYSVWCIVHNNIQQHTARNRSPWIYLVKILNIRRLMALVNYKL